MNSFSELGTRQHCRDRVTVFSRQKNVDYWIMSIFDMATPFLYFFLLRKLYYFVALSLSEKLKKFTRAQLCSFLTKDSSSAAF